MDYCGFQATNGARMNRSAPKCAQFWLDNPLVLSVCFVPFKNGAMIDVAFWSEKEISTLSVFWYVKNPKGAFVAENASLNA